MTREYAQSREQDPTKNQLANQMDMHNNEIGISIGIALSQDKLYNMASPRLKWIFTRDAVRNALNSGLLWFIDPKSNTLIPTTKP